MSLRTDGTMTISTDVDADRVSALQAAVVDAVQAWHDNAGIARDVGPLFEALLCNLCDLIQAAPDDNMRCSLADHAFEFVLRNCGVEPMAVLAYRATKRMMSDMPTAGTA